MSWTYKQKERSQLKSWFDGKVRDSKSGFKDYNDFLDWYDSRPKVCYYCGLTEEESQEVVHNGLLSSKRFPADGIIKQGRNRGYWLEVDRKDSLGIYSRENSELCCYFCNNDKSDIFNHQQYREFVNNRPQFIRNLLSPKIVK
jgi:hypothetical protein